MVILEQHPLIIEMAGNIPDIILSSDDPVDFTLLVAISGNEMISLQEKYVPDNNGKIIIRLRDLQFEFVSQIPGDQDIFVQNRAFATYNCEIGIWESFGGTLIGGGVERIGQYIYDDDKKLNVSAFLIGNWLTWQSQRKRVKLDDPEWLNYYTVMAAKVMVKAYFNAGDPETVEYVSLAAGKYYTINTKFSRLAALFSQQPAYFDIWTADAASGFRLSYIQRYVLAVESESEDVFIFKNTLGGIDSIRFTGRKEEDNQVAIQSALFDEDVIDYDADFKRLFSKNTGYFENEQERQHCKDFFNSTARYLVTPDGFLPVTVSNVQAKMTHGENATLNYDFKFSLSVQSRYSNLLRDFSPLPDEGTVPVIQQLIAPVLQFANAAGSAAVDLVFTDDNDAPNEASFEVQKSTDQVVWTAGGNPVANSTSFRVSGLTAATLYYFRVRAKGNGTTTSDSDWSNIMNATTAAGQQPVQLIAPLLNSATAIGTSAILLAYTDPNSNPNESYFEAQRSTDAANWTAAGNPAANSTSYQVTGLTANTNYYFRIRAKGNGTTTLDSDWSMTRNATTHAGSQQLTTPTLVLKAARGVIWGIVTGIDANAEQVIIEVSTDQANWDSTTLGRIVDGPFGSSIEYEEFQVENGVPYYVRVKATGSGYLDSSYASWNGTPNRIYYVPYSTGNIVGYMIYFPPDFEPDTPLPLLVGFHGLGQRSWTLNAALLNQIDMPWWLNNGNEEPGQIIVCPQYSSATMTQDAEALKVVTLVDHIATNYSIDLTRVYLKALSAGGAAAHAAMFTYPHRFAASVLTATFQGGQTINYQNWAQVPTWHLNGELDGLGGVSGMINQIKNAGGTAYLTVFLGLGHDDAVWNGVVSDAARSYPISANHDPYFPEGVNMFQWLKQHQKGQSFIQLFAPVLQTAVAASSTAINLTFTDPNSGENNESNFEVQRSTDQVNWTAAGNPVANSTSHQVTGLNANTAYYFRVRAKGNGTTTADSAWSNILSATTQSTGPIQLTAPTVQVSASNGMYNVNITNIDLRATTVIAEMGTDQVSWVFDQRSFSAPFGANIFYSNLSVQNGTTYYVRVKVVAPGYLDSNYTTASGTPQNIQIPTGWHIFKTAVNFGGLVLDTPTLDVYGAYPTGDRINRHQASDGYINFTEVVDIPGNEPWYGWMDIDFAARKLYHMAFNQKVLRVYNMTNWSLITSRTLTTNNNICIALCKDNHRLYVTWASGIMVLDPDDLSTIKESFDAAVPSATNIKVLNEILYIAKDSQAVTYPLISTVNEEAITDSRRDNFIAATYGLGVDYDNNYILSVKVQDPWTIQIYNAAGVLQGTVTVPSEHRSALQGGVRNVWRKNSTYYIQGHGNSHGYATFR